MRKAIERAMKQTRKPQIYSRAEPLLNFSPFETYYRKPYHNDVSFAESVGIDRYQLARFRRKGIRFFVADKICTDLGIHPSMIWGDEYWNPPRKLLRDPDTLKLLTEEVGEDE